MAGEGRSDSGWVRLGLSRVAAAVQRFQAASVLWALVAVVVMGLPATAQTGATGEPLAEVNGEAITTDEVERALGAPLRRLEQQIYDLKRQKLEALISERLLAREAAKRGVSVQALLDAEVTAKAGTVTDEEVETFFQANKARLKGEETAVREKMKTHLQNQKLASRRETFLQSLRSQASVVVHLRAPPVFRAEVSVDGAPFRGPATAPVTIVEFSDFQCPFCKQVVPTLTQVLSRYGEKVKLVYRDFPRSTPSILRPGRQPRRCGAPTIRASSGSTTTRSSRTRPSWAPSSSRCMPGTWGWISRASSAASRAGPMRPRCKRAWTRGFASG